MVATETCPGTVVTWETSYEIDSLGFNVYRDQGGQRVLLNPTILAAAGTLGGGGHRYQFVDATSTAPSRAYWVEEVRFDLTSGWHGPVAPVAGAACGGPIVAGVTFDGGLRQPRRRSACRPTTARPRPKQRVAVTSAAHPGGPWLSALAALLMILGARRRARRPESTKLSRRHGDD